MTRKPRQQKRTPQFRRRKKKHCYFCVEKKELDYKDVAFLRRFMTDRGKIASHQRMVSKVVKRARQMGLVPFVVD